MTQQKSPNEVSDLIVHLRALIGGVNHVRKYEITPAVDLLAEWFERSSPLDQAALRAFRKQLHALAQAGLELGNAFDDLVAGVDEALGGEQDFCECCGEPVLLESMIAWEDVSVCRDCDQAEMSLLNMRPNLVAIEGGAQ